MSTYLSKCGFSAKFHEHKLVEITLEGKYLPAPVVFSANGLWSHIPIKPIVEIAAPGIKQQSRLDYQPLFEKGARAPAPNSSRGG